MTLYEKILYIYPELADHPEYFWIGVISLQDNSDGNGPFIAVWNYEKPQPTPEQLAAIP